MKRSNHKIIIANIAARAARHLATAALLLVAATVGALPRLACAQTATTLASFDGTNGSHPIHGLLLASDGNFYGTTPFNNTPDYGTVFRITPTGTLTTIYRFSGSGPDEGNPLAALIQGSDGNLYGTTAGGSGGPNLYGTVFKLTLDGTLTTLFTFTFDPITATWPNGLSPEAALVQGADGNYYGTTIGGGGNPNPQGTIFKMSPAGDLLQSVTVHGANGFGAPQAPLVPGTDGAFYSTFIQTPGSVYRFSAAGMVTVLHAFTDTPDGATPNGGLVLGSDGNFYGTTEYGGTSHLGTAYRISQGGAYQELISFDNSTGQQPFGQMIQATDGNFYGTTVVGGSFSEGTVFQLTPAGVLTTVYNFNYNGDPHGSHPKGTLVQGADGRLYGTTQDGGTSDLGIVFALDLNLTSPLILTAAVSRKTHGSAGTFDIPLSLTGTPGVECRSSGGNHRLVFAFTNNVVSGNASVTTGTGNVVGSPTFVGNTMTVNLSGVADLQKITVTLSNVHDSFGQVLPNTTVSVNMLIGDTNANKTVNASDVAQTKGQAGLPVTTTNFREDVNANGSINASDVAQVKANAGHTLP